MLHSIHVTRFLLVWERTVAQVKQTRISLESWLVPEPLEADLPMMMSSLAGQEQDEWLRWMPKCDPGSCKLVLYSFFVLPAAGSACACTCQI